MNELGRLVTTGGNAIGSAVSVSAHSATNILSLCFTGPGEVSRTRSVCLRVVQLIGAAIRKTQLWKQHKIGTTSMLYFVIITPALEPSCLKFLGCAKNWPLTSYFWWDIWNRRIPFMCNAVENYITVANCWRAHAFYPMFLIILLKNQLGTKLSKIEC